MRTILNHCEVLVEVKREDLVGMHIGETAQMTKAKIEEAKGGVLFIDEAYQLMPKDSTRDFGKEAVETIMNALHDNDPVFIFAGYPADMERFINANAGEFFASSLIVYNQRLH
jgi:SpoVK/Ycf46/Vps4 family AAA+-type ATPase